jgi:hypothetical protein
VDSSIKREIASDDKDRGGRGEHFNSCPGEVRILVETGAPNADPHNKVMYEADNAFEIAANPPLPITAQP